METINKRSIRGPTITPLQTLLLIAALYNIAISAVWIPTASNSIADALSRHDFKRLANLGYQHDHHSSVTIFLPSSKTDPFRPRGGDSPPIHRHGNLSHSTISSNDSQPTAILPSSIAPLAPSHALISSIESKRHLSKSVLTQPSTPVILYAKVQQSQLAEKDYQNSIFNNWVDGKATQSTSTRFQNLIDSGKC